MPITPDQAYRLLDTEIGKLLDARDRVKHLADMDSILNLEQKVTARARVRDEIAAALDGISRVNVMDIESEPVTSPSAAAGFVGRQVDA